MSLPSKPIRKAAQTGNDNLARPTSKSVPGASAYKRKTATQSQASKSTYNRQSSGISPGNHNVNRPGETGGDHLGARPKMSDSKRKGVD